MIKNKKNTYSFGVIALIVLLIILPISQATNVYTQTENNDNTNIVEYKVYGYVKNRDTEEPLEGVYFDPVATICHETYSDENGYYELGFPKPVANAVIILSKDNYDFTSEDIQGFNGNIMTVSVTRSEPVKRVDLIAYEGESKEKTIFFDFFERLPLLNQIFQSFMKIHTYV